MAQVQINQLLQVHRLHKQLGNNGVCICSPQSNSEGGHAVADQCRDQELHFLI